MTYVNEQGYLERSTKSGRRNTNGKGTTRNWWLVKYASGGSLKGYIMFNGVFLPQSFIGKRVRFKVEVLEDKNEEKD